MADETTGAAGTLSERDVRHIARLSRLRLEDSQVGPLQTQLASILSHIARLQAVEVEGVAPMAHPLPISNRLDPDEPSGTMPVEGLLRNAPATEGRFLAVPKVLGDGGGA